MKLLHALVGIALWVWAVLLALSVVAVPSFHEVAVFALLGASLGFLAAAKDLT